MIKEVKSWFLLDHLKDLSYAYWPGWKIPTRGVYKASTPEQALGYAFKTSENQPIYYEWTEDNKKKKVRDGLFYFGDKISVERLIPAELEDDEKGIIYWTSFSEENKRYFANFHTLLTGIDFFLDLERSLETKKFSRKKKGWHFFIPEINNKLKKYRLVRSLFEEELKSFYEVTRRELEKFIENIGAEMPSKYIEEIESFVKRHSWEENAKVYYGIIPKKERSIVEQLSFI